MAMFDDVHVEVYEDSPQELNLLIHILRLSQDTNRKVTQLMADFSALEAVVARLATDVADTVTILSGISSPDPKVQAGIDDAVAKLTAAADALEAAEAAAKPAPAPAAAPISIETPAAAPTDAPSTDGVVVPAPTDVPAPAPADPALLDGSTPPQPSV